MTPGSLETAVADSATDLVAQSSAMRQAADLARLAAARGGHVLICGEPGSGRETLARAIHELSGQSASRFIVVNCSDGTPDEIEMRLFGLASGAGGISTPLPAVQDRMASGGAIVAAQGGTLVLRNLAEAPARVQAKLARLTRDGEALLDDRPAPVVLRMRLIAVVTGDPDAAVADGQFRLDLLDRLAQVRIDVPPLRQRREDVPILAATWLRELSLALGSEPQHFTRSALALLSALPWPGNATDLRGLVDTMVHAVDRPVIDIEDVLAHVRLDGAAPPLDTRGTLRDARMRFERDWISAVLVKYHGRVEEAAHAIGIQRTNLYRKIRQVKVDRSLLAKRG